MWWNPCKLFIRDWTFKIVSESSIGAGISGLRQLPEISMDYLYDTLDFKRDSPVTKNGFSECSLKADEMLEKLKMQEREIESLKQHAINDEVNEIQGNNLFKWN